MSATDVAAEGRTGPGRAWRPGFAALALALLLLAVGLAEGARREGARGRAVQEPVPLAEACRSTNPYLAVAAMARGREEEPRPDAPAVLVFRDGEPPRVLATQGQVGSVYGLAYDAARETLYAAAYHRRGLGFGPGGPGQVYAIGVETGEIRPFAQLAAGPDRHTGGLFDDADAAPWVGKTSLGDIDLAEDGSAFFVANLFDGRVYEIGVPDGQARGSFAHGASREPWWEDARLFGLAVKDGEVYHGVVNSRESGEPGELFEARIYRSSPRGRDMTSMIRMGLDYGRGVRWSAWDDERDGRDADAPMLVDIAFADDGSPVLGLRDREADRNPACVFDPACAAGPSLGDLMATEPRDSSGWRPITNPPWFSDTDGADVDALWGGLATLSGLDIVVSSGRDLAAAPDNPRPPGLFGAWYAVGSGALLRTEALLGAGGTPWDHLGGGDVEMLCDPDAMRDPELRATATAEAGAVATATERQRGIIRATQRVPTLTAHAPTAVARETVAVQTATALAPTLAAAAPTRTARATAAAETATAFVPAMTVMAPTATALAQEALDWEPRRPARATAVARAYDAARFSCGSHNPFLITTCFVPALDGVGDPYGRRWLDGQPVLVAFNDTAGDDLARHIPLAWQTEIGAVFGEAYDLERDEVYVGAYTKRLADYGPLGAGGIYRLELATGRLLPWARMFAGGRVHNMSSDFDISSANSVGRTALGDLEITTEADELFAVNLYDRLIYRFSVPDGRLLGAIPHGAAGEPWAEDARPFALAWRDGWLYHGVVDSREHDEDGERTLAAYVYRSRRDGSELKEVLRVDLDYPRSGAWEPWTIRFQDGVRIREPMLVDIEFREDGDLILGFRDRQGDSRVLYATGGDLVVTHRVADRYIGLPAPEFYQDNIRHDESSWGTMATLPWLDEVVSTVIDPITIWSGGAGWFDNVSGSAVRLETIYVGRNVTFGKASGLGDLEAMCAPLTPTPSPTATEPLHTPTPSDTPTRTVTPSVTPTASPSATATPWTIYLPMAEKAEICLPGITRTDAVLVLDMSTSMYRATRSGRTKHEAAIEAAREFVQLLDFAPDGRGRTDRVGVVGFNDSAWIETDITARRDAALAALDRLTARIEQGTRLDLALQRGQEALDRTPRVDGSRPVLILLTDGLPNRVPTPEGGGTQEDTVRAAAARSKAAGTRIFTIGLGQDDDVLAALLTEVASTPRDYYFAPDGEDLAGIYRQIAGRIDECP